MTNTLEPKFKDIGGICLSLSVPMTVRLWPLPLRPNSLQHCPLWGYYVNNPLEVHVLSHSHLHPFDICKCRQRSIESISGRSQ
jgi:hypothetical protein